MAIPHAGAAGPMPHAGDSVAAGFTAPRAIILLSTAIAFAAGGLAMRTPGAAHAAALAGPDLTRLLRAMAAIKTLMAAGAIAAVLWRTAMPTGPVRLAAYAGACAAMAAGPGLIWSMAYVGTGALLLHGGLVAAILLLWRDPAVASRLKMLVDRRRHAIAAELR